MKSLYNVFGVLLIVLIFGSIIIFTTGCAEEPVCNWFGTCEDEDDHHKPTIIDRDKDGIADNQDAFPDNPMEWNDTDSDGIARNDKCHGFP